MSSIVIAGDTSGSVTLQAPSVAGATVVNLPSTSMNIGTGGGSVATNTAFGTSALASNTTGSNSTAVGYLSLYTNITNPDSTAIGAQALYAATDGYNTAVGFKAGFSQTTGASNTYIGRFVAGAAATTTGSFNTAMGNRSLQVVTSGSANVSIGAEALQANTTASDNTAVGRSALYTNTTGASNVALGKEALFNNTTASSNTAVGYQSLYSNTTGVNATAIGSGALYTGTAINWSVAVGYQAGYSSTANHNVLMGAGAGYSLTTGDSNTFIGTNNGTSASCGYYVTTGSKNTILGGYSGNQGGLDIRTLSNRIVLSDGDGNPRGYFNNVGDFFVGGTDIIGGASCKFSAYSSDLTNTNGIGIKNGTANTGGAFIRFINSTDATIGTISQNASTTVAYNTSSDYRLKENIAPMTGALAKVAQLKPVTYKWKLDGSDGQGFIAHELQEVVPDCVTGAKDALDKNGRPDYQGIDTSFLVATLTAAIQEQQALITTLTERITALEGA